MSVDIMTRIFWRQDLNPTEKFVAVALADAANDEGVCWPAIETVAEKTSLSKRSVQNSIRALEAKMLLRIRARKDRSSYYIFNLDNLPHVSRERRRKESGPHEITGAGAAPLFDEGVQMTTGTGAARSMTGAAAAPRTVREPSLEPDSPPSPCGEGHPHEPELFETAAEPNLPVVREQPLEEHVEEQWKALAEEEPGIAGVRTLDDSRKKKISARARAVAADPAGMRAAWDEIFRKIRGSPFLRGHAPPGKDRSSPFRLTLDFVLQPRQFLKILEGGYDDRHDRRTHDTESGRRFGPAEQAGRASLERLRAAYPQYGNGGAPG